MLQKCIMTIQDVSIMSVLSQYILYNHHNIYTYNYDYEFVYYSETTIIIMTYNYSELHVYIVLHMHAVIKIVANTYIYILTTVMAAELILSN